MAPFSKSLLPMTKPHQPEGVSREEILSCPSPRGTLGTFCVRSVGSMSVPYLNSSEVAALSSNPSNSVSIVPSLPDSVTDICVKNIFLSQNGENTSQNNPTLYLFQRKMSMRRYNYGGSRGYRNPALVDRAVRVGAAAAAAATGYQSYKRYKPAKKYPRRSQPLRRRGSRYLSRHTRPLQRKRTLKQNVKELQRKVRADEATHTHRSVNTDILSAGANLRTLESKVGNDFALIDVALAEFRYYNPSSPATLVTADASTGTFKREIHVKNMTATIKVCNNYGVSANVKIYLLTPRVDTSILPETAFSNSLTDQMITPNTSSPLMHVTDADQFKDLWSIKRVKHKYLKPGDSMSMTSGASNWSYDPSVVDSHALTFQRKHKAFVFLVSVQGVLAHDSLLSATQQGLNNASVDVETY